jgi:hypothetical protein
MPTRLLNRGVAMNKPLRGLAVACALVIAASTIRVAAQRPAAPMVGGCQYVPRQEFNTCALAKAKSFSPPRTPDGKPDMQGPWETPGGAYNFEAGAANGRGFVVDPPDGRIPFLPFAREQRDENVAHYLDPYTICQPAGVPRQLVLFRSHQITQFPSYVTIVNEAGGHNFRVVYTDGRPHPASGVKLWMGNSRGRWDGNTLVIETTNFNGRAWLDSGGTPGSEELRVVERLTLIDKDTLHYSATVEDPKVFARPWTIVFGLRRMEPGYEQMEEACHESDHDGEHMMQQGYKPYTGLRPSAGAQR